MARKPNYSFEKRKKEQDRAAKKEAKKEERLRRKAEGDTGADEIDELTGRLPDGTLPPPADDDTPTA